MAFPTPRSWEFANRALQKFEQSHEVLLESLQACVGAAAGIDLNAFVEHLEDMPDLDAIVSGNETAVPTEIDLQYAVATALVGRAIRADVGTAGNLVLGNILRYAQLFSQREMGVMMISYMHRAIGELLFAVEEFALWADSVADLMLYEA